MQRESELIASLSQVNKSYWDSKSSSSESLFSVIYTGSKPVLPVHLRRKVFHVFPCFALTCTLLLSLSLSSEAQICFSALRWWTREGFSSSSTAWLGGLGSLGGSLLLSLLRCLPYLSGDFPTEPLSLRYSLVPNEESLLSESGRNDRMASAWFRQPTHVQWSEWEFQPFSGRGCLASYSNLDVLMV